MMREYEVFDYEFNVVGTIRAANAEQALQLAKIKFRGVVGIMVAPKE